VLPLQFTLTSRGERSSFTKKSEIELIA
jgi:hypothetical protein